MKLGKLGLCFLSLKLSLTYKNSELSFFSVVQSINSELGIRNFHSKHDSMCKRKIPSYCFCVCSKTAITLNSLIGNSEFSENTKLLLSLWVDVIYTNLVYP